MLGTRRTPRERTMNTFMHNLSVRQAQNLPSHIRTHNTLIEAVEYRDTELQRQLRIDAIASAVALCQANETSSKPVKKVEPSFNDSLVEFFNKDSREFEMLHLIDDGYVTYEETIEECIVANGM